MGALLISQSDLELHIGVQTVAQLSTDDGSETPNAAVIAKVLQGASDAARGILRSGFSDDQVDDLVDALVGDDQAVKDHVLDIAAGLLGQRRPGLLSPDGTTPFSGFRRAAEKALKETAAGKRRAAGETNAGSNSKLKARTNQSTKKPVFASTKDDPVGPGGY